MAVGSNIFTKLIKFLYSINEKPKDKVTFLSYNVTSLQVQRPKNSNTVNSILSLLTMGMMVYKLMTFVLVYTRYIYIFFQIETIIFEIKMKACLFQIDFFKAMSKNRYLVLDRKFYHFKNTYYRS